MDNHHLSDCKYKMPMWFKECKVDKQKQIMDFIHHNIRVHDKKDRDNLREFLEHSLKLHLNYNKAFEGIFQWLDTTEAKRYRKKVIACQECFDKFNQLHRTEYHLKGFQQCLRNMGCQNWQTMDVKKIFEWCDINGDGTIDFHEFFHKFFHELFSV
jgi:hypothetical protein